MTTRSPSRPRPLSSAPPARTVPPTGLRRKYSLDHDHGQQDDDHWELPGTPQHAPEDASGEVTSSAQRVEGEEAPPHVTTPDENHNQQPSGKRDDTKTCGRKVLKKQASFESIGCDDNYFYDFFDRNYRPATPAQSTSEDPPHPAVEEATSPPSRERENINVVGTSRAEVNGNSGASSKLRRNVNSVRPKSWLMTSSSKPEDNANKRARRRQTDPCGRDFLSNYERALSSLLYQPYDCRTEGPSASTTSTYDDSDVSYWLNPERRSVGECCLYQNHSSDSSSRSSLSSSSSSTGGKPWGDSKDPSSSSIRALLREWRSGNSASAESQSSDLGRLSREPLGALAVASAQSTAGHGREMLVRVSEPESRGSQSNLLATTSSATQSEEVTVSACYRAVPATVSAVPVIACSNVSNVRIVQQSPRTFTSTEAQTDDVVVTPSREQRRQERRERRHRRRLLHPQTTDPALWHPPVTEPLVDRLPDILNSHLPPPYTTLPVGLAPHPPPPLPPPIAVAAVPGSPPPQPTGFRLPFAIVPAGRRRSRLSPHFTPEDEPKSCCGVAVSQTISIRWFIVLIFLVGLCCAAVGTILGAVKATGREHLTVSLLMIGVGIVLVAVSGVAWRLTSQDAPSCRAMLGLSGDDAAGEPNRRFVPRLPPSYGRPHHPYAAMMYPEFQYRAPPPSYQASMQEYRLRLLLLDRHSGTPGSAASPPPTYRSHPGSLLRAPIGLRGPTPSQSEYSRPPSYRSRTSSRPDPATSHSREPSGSDPGQAVNVITVHPHIVKLAPSPPLPAKNPVGKDANLVTIVQTTSEPTGPVIVTISGQGPAPSPRHDSEMEILAHL